MTEPTATPPEGAGPDDSSAPPEPAKRVRSAELEAKLHDMEAALDAERQMRGKADKQLAAMKQSMMTDAEKAVAKALADGKLEGLRTAGVRVAAAEFRARAASKLGELSGALDTDLIDFTRFVGDDGEPDVSKIDAAIDRLAAVLPQPANGKPHTPTVPTGPRQDATEQDWLRAAMSGKG